GFREFHNFRRFQRGSGSKPAREAGTHRRLFARPGFRLRREVALSRPRVQAWFLQLHLELVDLAVEDRGGEAQDILAVQLLGDARKGGTQFVCLLQQEEPAARLPASFFRPRSGLERWRRWPLKISVSRPIA